MKSQSHNLGHYLWVVMKRLVKLLIMLPVSLYLVAIGWSFARVVLIPVITVESKVWLDQRLLGLPWVESIVDLITTTAGRLYIEGSAWWAMVVGIPLMLIGLNQGIIQFFNLIRSITAPSYNQNHCPICNPG